MKGITAIVYRSNSGFTARYAGMLARAAGIPAYDLAQWGDQAPRGSRVIAMGWLCAGRIKGLSSARGRYDVRAVCAVGMAQLTPELEDKLRRDNHLGGLPLFYLRGGYRPDRIKGIYRAMMAPMIAAITRRPARTEEEAQTQEALIHGADWFSPAQLTPVQTWLDAQRGG